MQWQPIATVPDEIKRDGTRILATDGEEVCTSEAKGKYIDGSTVWIKHSELEDIGAPGETWIVHAKWTPTHWMPLPPPPGGADE